MLVSIIIPVYNSSKTIFRCIESVVVSVEKITNDYEIICIDDGSVDDSLQKLKEIASDNEKIIVIHQENSGAATARNKGLDLAKGNYIAFNDSDDEWLENHFEDLMNVFITHPEIDCVSGLHEAKDIKVRFIKRIEGKLYKTTLKSQLLKNYFSPPNSMLNRRIIDNGVRFNSGMRYAEEGFFFNWINNSYYACFLNTTTAQSIFHKKAYGESGLTGNLKGMEQGELFNIRYAYKHFGIPFYFFVMTTIFSYIKYIRRILIVKFRTL